MKGNTHTHTHTHREIHTLSSDAQSHLGFSTATKQVQGEKNKKKTEVE